MAKSKTTAKTPASKEKAGGRYIFKGKAKEPARRRHYENRRRSEFLGADSETTGRHSVITDFTRFLGRSTSQPFRTA